MGTWRYMEKSSGRIFFLKMSFSRPSYRSVRISVWCLSWGYCFLVPR